MRRGACQGLLRKRVRRIVLHRATMRFIVVGANVLFASMKEQCWALRTNTRFAPTAWSFAAASFRNDTSPPQVERGAQGSQEVIPFALAWERS
jgi:hypothetical protein